MDIYSLAAKIAENRIQKKIVRSAEVPIGSFSPYDIQKAVAMHFLPMGGWKAGGTNEKTQNLFSVEHAFFGPISENFIFTGTDIHLDSSLFCQPLMGEVEICFSLHEELDSFVSEFDAVTDINGADLQQKLHSYITEVHLCLEMPWSQFSQPESGIDFLIADMCGSNALIVGAGIPFDDWADNLETDVFLSDAQRHLTHGTVTASVVHPLQVLQEFIKFCSEHKISFQKETYLATGGVTNCVELPSNQTLHIHSDKIPGFHFFFE